MFNSQLASTKWFIILIIVLKLPACVSPLEREEMSQKIKKAISEEAAEIELHVGGEVIPLVMIPEGDFFMGSPPSEIGHREVEGPVQHVTISTPFYIGRYEITQMQYAAVLGSNPGSFHGNDLAVDQVTYSDALRFSEKLSAIIGVKVTLPTEAQWEYACRAGTATRFYSGDKEEDLDRVAWYKGNSGDRVHTVGQKLPNAFGLYDMLGNVWELCLDSLGSYDVMSKIDPLGTISEGGGAMRGGGWMNSADYCRCACGLQSNDMFGGSGLRIVINPATIIEPLPLN